MGNITMRKLRVRVEDLEAENARLREAGTELYQALHAEAGYIPDNRRVRLTEASRLWREALAATRSEPRYPCAECGALRTKAEGGTTFTVCDDCWGALATSLMASAVEFAKAVESGEGED